MEDKKKGYTPPTLPSGWLMMEDKASAMPAMPRQEMRPLAMVYINKQEWGETYEPEVGFDRGTIFPPLDLPFMGKGACRYE